MLSRTTWRLFTTFLPQGAGTSLQMLQQTFRRGLAPGLESARMGCGSRALTGSDEKNDAQVPLRAFG